MNKLLLALPVVLFAAAPAHATGGLVCRTAGARPLELSLVIGHTAVSSIVSARLSERGRAVPVTVVQSWLEPNELWLDLVDPNATRHEARLRAKRNGRVYDGTIWRGGRGRWVRCRED
ncbi:MAG: hypothetical protein ABIP91_08315 [Sphingomicrobium sp.]